MANTTLLLSYAREDETVAAEFLSRLRKLGVDAWWDREIPPSTSDFRLAIQDEIARRDWLVPIWTENSIRSKWVRDEVRYAEDLGKPVFAVKLDAVATPVGLGHFQHIDVSANERTVAIPTAVAAICKAIGSAQPARRGVVQFKDIAVQLPCFVRSVSSHETFLAPDAAVGLLSASETEISLVSAYDLANDTGGRLLAGTNALAGQGVVLLDSGNYEAWRKHDPDWTPELFLEVAATVTCHAAFSFDNTRPQGPASDIVRDVVGRSITATDRLSVPIIPIVHAPRDSEGALLQKHLPEICAAVCGELRPLAIAVPERELGDGIVARAGTVAAIRSALARLDWYQPLHLLGTGNPLAMAVFAAAGADMFDGLEWCRTVVDDGSKFLFHYQQYDFFSYQDRLSTDAFLKSIVDDSSVPYTVKLAFHNLYVFRQWEKKLRDHAKANTLDWLLIDSLPDGAFTDLSAALPQVFAR